jgi:glycogen debranching enzyme
MGDVVCESRRYLDVYSNEPLVLENSFRGAAPDRAAPPALAAVRHLLPEVFIDAPVSTPRALAEAAAPAFDKTWALAFKNLSSATAENGFAAPFLDSAFNDCLFMWDSVFCLAFARFGRRAFAFQRTLDTFYRKQHPDGFISREIQESDGQDKFHRADLPSTGPNILAWAEWEHYEMSGDLERLRRVFPPLAAFHSWMAKHRTHADGSYFSCGLACGMDNQPRVPPGSSAWCDHGFSSWVDATAQALLSAQLLVRMAEALGDAGEGGSRAALVRELRAESAALVRVLNERLWCERRQMYCDRRLRGDQALSDVKTVGSFWTLLAGAVPRERLHAFAAHLDDPREFNRPTRVPSLSADHADYRADGGYWLGASWPSTTYMVLRGLTAAGLHDHAADIGLNVRRVDAHTYAHTYAHAHAHAHTHAHAHAHTLTR